MGSASRDSFPSASSLSLQTVASTPSQRLATVASFAARPSSRGAAAVAAVAAAVAQQAASEAATLQSPPAARRASRGARVNLFESAASGTTAFREMDADIDMQGQTGSPRATASTSGADLAGAMPSRRVTRSASAHSRANTPISAPTSVGCGIHGSRKGSTQTNRKRRRPSDADHCPDQDMQTSARCDDVSTARDELQRTPTGKTRAPAAGLRLDNLSPVAAVASPATDGKAPGLVELEPGRDASVSITASLPSPAGSATPPINISLATHASRERSGWAAPVGSGVGIEPLEEQRQIAMDEAGSPRSRRSTASAASSALATPRKSFSGSRGQRFRSPNRSHQRALLLDDGADDAAGDGAAGIGVDDDRGSSSSSSSSVCASTVLSNGSSSFVQPPMRPRGQQPWPGRSHVSATSRASLGSGAGGSAASAAGTSVLATNAAAAASLRAPSSRAQALQRASSLQLAEQQQAAEGGPPVPAAVAPLMTSTVSGTAAGLAAHRTSQTTRVDSGAQTVSSHSGTRAFQPAVQPGRTKTAGKTVAFNAPPSPVAAMGAKPLAPHAQSAPALEEAAARTLLSESFCLLLDFFRALDTVLVLLRKRWGASSSGNRATPLSTFEAVKPGVEQSCGRTFTLRHVAQIAGVWPGAFKYSMRRVTADNLPLDGGLVQATAAAHQQQAHVLASGQWRLVIEANSEALALQGAAATAAPPESQLAGRRAVFQTALLSVADAAHASFLSSRGLDPARTPRWHPEFAWKDVPPPEAPLPTPPDATVSAAPAGASAQGAKEPGVPVDAITAAADAAEMITADPELAGLPQALLAKIRAKQRELAAQRPALDQRAASKAAMALIGLFDAVLAQFLCPPRKTTMAVGDLAQRVQAASAAARSIGDIRGALTELAVAVPEWASIKTLTVGTVFKVNWGVDAVALRERLVASAAAAAATASAMEEDARALRAQPH